MNIDEYRIYVFPPRIGRYPEQPKYLKYFKYSK